MSSGGSNFPPTEEYNPFQISPESRMLMRRIPYFHLSGYGSRPDVSGARAKVDSYNASYRGARSKFTDTCAKGVIRHTKTDYSNIKSKIDTGKRKTETATVVSKSANDVMLTELSLARRKLARMKHSLTHPQTSTNSVISGEGKFGSSKISSPGTKNTRLKLVRSRVDSRDPHPEVTRQIHSLEELQIIPGCNKEKLNPRFIQHPKDCHRSAKPCLSASFEKANTVTSTSKPLRKSNSASVSKSPAARKSAGTFDCSNISQRSRVSTRRANTEMEVLEQMPAVLQNRESDETEVVKMKPRIAQMNHEYPSKQHTQEFRDEQELRDSVSSSESVGVNPEYCSMDLDIDAFSAEQEQVKLDQQRDWEEGSLTATSGDKIVGFEVSTDSSETTVNLLHLFGRKNKTVEETKVEYHDHKLWVIGEEDESEDEMEEEIFLSDGGSGGDPETITLATQPVPELFILDENNIVVEKIKTGRRKRSSGSSLSDSHLPPLVSSPQQLSLHTLTLDDKRS